MFSLTKIFFYVAILVLGAFIFLIINLKTDWMPEWFQFPTFDRCERIENLNSVIGNIVSEPE